MGRWEFKASKLCRLLVFTILNGRNFGKSRILMLMLVEMSRDVSVLETKIHQNISFKTCYHEVPPFGLE